MDTLLGVYSPWARRFARPRLRRRFNSLPGVLPTLLDGQMNPGEWIPSTSGLCKTDFEHHNFGGGELDLVDPAYDLAAAIYEFQLSESAEQDLLRRYAAESGDTTIQDRLLLYKLLYGTVCKMRAAYHIPIYERRAGPEAAQKRREWPRLSLAAQNFLTFQMNRFCGALLGPAAVRWSKLLFFMDLDGILDQSLMGFPHTTWSGLQALALLRRHGISVVPNTGRSVEQVRHYVQSYGFPGGLAEYGSVFVDAVGQTEMILIDAQAREQLDRCREAIQNLDGAVIDPGYRFSVRAFRCSGARTAGLPAEEVRDFLTRSGFNRLDFITTEADTYIFQTGISKGSGLRAVKDYLGLIDRPVAAIGDTDYDLDMLQAAEFPYMPAHGSEKLRRESGTKGKLRVMAEPFQRGLLSAARDLARNRFKTSADDHLDPLSEQSRGGLVGALLRVPDRSLPAQIFAALNGYRL
jgi:hydroxymethylpyrimidine pyrophosphatase-like HAD family hydrolase